MSQQNILCKQKRNKDGVRSPTHIHAQKLQYTQTNLHFAYYVVSHLVRCRMIYGVTEL